MARITVTLTVEESAEFTLFNAAAFDLLRSEGKETGEHPLCWLVMSDEAKAECHTKLCKLLRSSMASTFGGLTEASIRDRVNAQDTIELLFVLDKWRQAELTYKQYRADGNPRAYFAD